MKLRQLTFLLVLFFAVPLRAGESVQLMPEWSRGFHNFNMAMFESFQPLVEEYRDVKIYPLHRGVVNALANLSEPQTIINSVLVLDIRNAATATGRFLLNSTVGLLGAIDVAGGMGFRRDRRDFGGVMGVWGVGYGARFTLPLIGPTNLRDFSGMFVDGIFNPLSYFVLGYPIVIALSVSGMSYGIYEGYDIIMGLHTMSIDSHAAFQTMSAQMREAEIRRIRLGIRGAERGQAQLSSHDFDFDMDFDME